MYDIFKNDLSLVFGNVCWHPPQVTNDRHAISTSYRTDSGFL